MKNLLAVLFVVLTQAACVAYYSMEPPASFGSRHGVSHD